MKLLQATQKVTTIIVVHLFAAAGALVGTASGLVLALQEFEWDRKSINALIKV